MKATIKGNHPVSKYVTWISWSVEETKFVEDELRKHGYEVETLVENNIDLVEINHPLLPSIGFVEVDHTREYVKNYYSKHFNPNPLERELRQKISDYSKGLER